MYRFRLQRVLEYRRRREDDRQQALRQAQLLHENQVVYLEELQIAARTQEEALESTHGTEFSSAEWSRWQHYYTRLVQDITVQSAKVDQLTQQVAACRQQLLVARQETRVIEKLDEKARQRYLAALAQHDNQLLDELALTRTRQAH